MTYKRIRKTIDEIGRFGSVFGLDIMQEILLRVGYISSARVFHVAGTNGKGSVCAFISSALRSEGYKTGLYTSPGVFSYRERFRINGIEMTKREFSSIAKTVLCECDKMVSSGQRQPTAFEIETAIALLWFQKSKCDTIVLETGLGGRLDATNAVKGKFLCVISSISVDHTAQLGNTIEAIAFEKFAIASGYPFVTLEENAKYLSKQMKSLAVLTKKPKLISNTLNGVSFIYGDKEYQTKLCGAHQAENAALAIDALKLARELGLNISDISIESGIKNAVNHGRLEKFQRGKKTFVLDDSHNAGAAEALSAALETYFKNEKFALVLGMFKDKDYKSVLSLLCPSALFVAAVKPKGERGLSAESVLLSAKEFNENSAAFISMREAIRAAANIADNIIVAGSLSILKEARDEIKRYRG